MCCEVVSLDEMKNVTSCFFESTVFRSIQQLQQMGLPPFSFQSHSLSQLPTRCLDANLDLRIAPDPTGSTGEARRSVLTSEEDSTAATAAWQDERWRKGASLFNGFFIFPKRWVQTPSSPNRSPKNETERSKRNGTKRSLTTIPS